MSDSLPRHLPHKIKGHKIKLESFEMIDGFGEKKKKVLLHKFTVIFGIFSDFLRF